jgi:hypothetical protein
MDPAELRLAFVDFNALLPNGLRIVTSSGAADTETESAIRETKRGSSSPLPRHETRVEELPKLRAGSNMETSTSRLSWGGGQILASTLHFGGVQNRGTFHPFTPQEWRLAAWRSSLFQNLHCLCPNIHPMSFVYRHAKRSLPSVGIQT